MVTQMKFIEPWFLFISYNEFRKNQFRVAAMVGKFLNRDEDIFDMDVDEEIIERRWQRDTICINGCPLCEDRFPCMNNIFATYPGVPIHHENISGEILARWDGAYYGKGGGIKPELNLNNY